MSAELELRRIALASSWTLGTLLWTQDKKVPEWFTLEDAVREVPGVPVAQWKLPKVTAIPAGRYRVGWRLSPHFGREMPWLQDVPGFEDIYFHGGNTSGDTDGCVLTGYAANIMSGALQNSSASFYALNDRLRAATAAGEVWVTVRNP